MAITYASDTLSISGGHYSGTFTEVTPISGNRYYIKDSVVGSWCPSCSTFEQKYFMCYVVITGGTGSGTIAYAYNTKFFDLLNLEMEFGNGIVPDTTTQYQMCYNLADIVQADTDNAWGLYDSSTKTWTCDFEFGNGTDDYYLEMNIPGEGSEISIKLPDTPTIDAKTYVCQIKDNAYIMFNYEFDIANQSFSQKLLQPAGSLELIKSPNDNTDKVWLSKGDSTSTDNSQLLIYNYTFMSKFWDSTDYFGFNGILRIKYCSITGITFAFINDDFNFDSCNLLTTYFFSRQTNFGDLNVSDLTCLQTRYVARVGFDNTFTYTRCNYSGEYGVLNRPISAYNSVTANVNFYDCSYIHDTYLDASTSYVVFEESQNTSETYANDSWIKEYKSVNLSITDSNGDPITSALLYIENNSGTEEDTQSTDGDGEHTQIDILTFSWHWVSTGYPDLTITKTDHFPHIFKYRKYNYSYLEESLHAKIPVVGTKILTDNNNITQTTEATVAAYSGFAINTTSETITVSSNHTINELYDWVQWWGCQSANIDKDELLITVDGTNYISPYNITIDNAELTGTGNVDISGESKTLTLSNGGTTTLTFKDVSGTHTSIILTDLQSNSEVRIYKVSDDSELVGIENSGTTFVGDYLHAGTDFDVYIIIHHLSYEHIKMENITLTDVSASLPIQQRIDRNYNNP